MVKIMTHIEVRSFKILKLKNLLLKDSNLPRSLEFVIHQNCTCLRGQVFRKLYGNDELNFFAIFNLAVSDPKVN